MSYPIRNLVGNYGGIAQYARIALFLSGRVFREEFYRVHNGYEKYEVQM